MVVRWVHIYWKFLQTVHQSIYFAIYDAVQLLSRVWLFAVQLHGLQHTRLPYPSPTPRTYSNSCPSCQWCHPTISSSVNSFSSCLQSFPASGSFQLSRLFASIGQRTGASAWVLPMNVQDWFPLGWTGWISLLSKGHSQESPTPQFKSISSLALSFLYILLMFFFKRSVSPIFIFQEMYLKDINFLKGKHYMYSVHLQ